MSLSSALTLAPASRSARSRRGLSSSLSSIAATGALHVRQPRHHDTGGTMKAFTEGDVVVVKTSRPTFLIGGTDVETEEASKGDRLRITGVWADGDGDYENLTTGEPGVISPKCVKRYVEPKPVALPFTIADKYGDPVTVEAGPARGRVYISTTDAGRDAQASLSAKQARKIARALLAAAQEVSE